MKYLIHISLSLLVLVAGVVLSLFASFWQFESADRETIDRLNFQKAIMYYNECLEKKTLEAFCRQETKDLFHLKELK